MVSNKIQYAQNRDFETIYRDSNSIRDERLKDALENSSDLDRVIKLTLKRLGCKDKETAKRVLVGIYGDTDLVKSILEKEYTSNPIPVQVAA